MNQSKNVISSYSSIQIPCISPHGSTQWLKQTSFQNDSTTK